jgi:hypothetical protein
VLPPGHRVVGLRQADGMPPSPQHARSVIAAERLVEKHLTQNQMFGGRRTTGHSLQPESLLTYISWYINGYGRPWTPLDMNPKMRPIYGQFAGSEGVLLPTTEQKAFAVPLSDPRCHVHRVAGAIVGACVPLTCVRLHSSVFGSVATMQVTDMSDVRRTIGS